MMRRIRRSLAWRLRDVARGLGDPDDHDAWLAIDRADAARRKLVDAEPVQQHEVLGFCRRLAPFEVEGYEKIRLGNSNDGGYVFIDDFAEISTVISCGISTDVSCDLAFAELGKDVVQFDHTVKGPPVDHPRFSFRKQAIDERLEIPGSARLSDVIRELGDRDKSDLLLKIDIEGSEWKTFASIPKSDLLRCRQIACEFHHSSKLAERECFALYQAAVAAICEGFFPAHVHANNFQGFAAVLGVPMPEVFEVTFVNRTFYRPGAHQKVGPLAVDAPNDAGAPDLFLGSPFSLGSD
jgi:hypothetical protein